jgi:methyl-accepting chemotaxis protein
MAFSAVSNIQRSSNFSHKLVTKDLAQGVLATKVQSLAQQASLNLLLILHTKDRDKRVKLYKLLDKNKSTFDGVLDSLIMLGGRKVDKPLENIVALHLSYQTLFLQTVDFVEWDSESAISHFEEATRPSLILFLNSLEQYLVNLNHETIEQFDLMEKANNQSINFTIGLTLVAVLLGAILSVFVSRSIIRPIRQALRVAKRMSQGDLRFDLELIGNDEISQLMVAFSIMSTELSGLMSSVCKSAMEVQSSSSSLNNSVENIAHVSIEQLDVVKNIAVTMSHFSEQSNQAAKTTSEALEQAERARKLAAQGKELIERATSEFDMISRSIKNSSDSVDTLRAQSIEVRKLVITVHEISDQTNLLALNAAIEAARAGNVGRGFSVVADEIRSLAFRTGRATQEINDVIDSMESVTKTSVEKISQGREDLAKGVSLLRKMIQPLSDLNFGAKASAEQLLILEDAVVKQATDSDLIDKEIQFMRKLAIDHQSSIHLISNTTENLEGLSRTLERRVSKFDLNGKFT